MPPRAIAAALGRGDFESGSDSKSGLVRGGWIVPNLTQIESDSDSIRFGGRCPLTFAAALDRDDFESGSGGRCPLTLAAALGHIDFESGSDSKSG